MKILVRESTFNSSVLSREPEEPKALVPQSDSTPGQCRYPVRQILLSEQCKLRNPVQTNSK